MDKKVLIYGAVGVGVLLLMVSRGSSTGGSNTGATLASFADTNATAVQILGITAARDKAAMASHSADLQTLAGVFATNSGYAASITAQSLAQNANLVGAAMTNAAVIKQSHIASALAISLNNTNNDTARYGIDAEKYIVDATEKTKVTVARFGKQTAISTAKIGAYNQTVKTIGSTISNVFGH